MNGQNSANIAKPIGKEAKDATKFKLPDQHQFVQNQLKERQYTQRSTNLQCSKLPLPDFLSPAGATQPMQQGTQTSIFQQPSQQMQQEMVPQMQMSPMMPQNAIQPRTSIMTSGRGVRIAH